MGNRKESKGQNAKVESKISLITWRGRRERRLLGPEVGGRRATRAVLRDEAGNYRSTTHFSNKGKIYFDCREKKSRYLREREKDKYMLIKRRRDAEGVYVGNTHAMGSRVGCCLEASWLTLHATSSRRSVVQLVLLALVPLHLVSPRSRMRCIFSNLLVGGTPI